MPWGSEQVGAEPGGSPSRRRLLQTAGAVAATTALAGCGGASKYRFTASPVVLPPGTRTELGYETLHDEPVVIERSRTVGGVDVEATVESHIVVYWATTRADRATAAMPTVAATSTPSATVLGRSFNPIARRSLANLLTSETGVSFLWRAGLGRVGHVRERVRWERGPTFVAGREGTCLGVETTLESYAGVLGGSPPSVAFVHLTRVDAADVAIAAAVHGHDIDESDGRTFVGPDAGYLSLAAFKDAVNLFATTTAALRYRE